MFCEAGIVLLLVQYILAYSLAVCEGILEVKFTRFLELKACHARSQPLHIVVRVFEQIY